MQIFFNNKIPAFFISNIFYTTARQSGIVSRAFVYLIIRSSTWRRRDLIISLLEGRSDMCLIFAHQFRLIMLHLRYPEETFQFLLKTHSTCGFSTKLHEGMLNTKSYHCHFDVINKLHQMKTRDFVGCCCYGGYQIEISTGIYQKS